MTEEIKKEQEGLSDAQKEKIQAKVKAKLEKEAQAKLEDEYEKKILADAKRAEHLKNAKPGDPNDKGLVPVFVSLPSCGDGVRIDGHLFVSNKIHYVTPQLADVLYEAMGRGSDHEDSLNGKTALENRGRRLSRNIAR